MSVRAISQNAVRLNGKFHHVDTRYGCCQGRGWSLRRAFSIESSKTVTPLNLIEIADVVRASKANIDLNYSKHLIPASQMVD